MRPGCGLRPRIAWGASSLLTTAPAAHPVKRGEGPRRPVVPSGHMVVCFVRATAANTEPFVATIELVSKLRTCSSASLPVINMIVPSSLWQRRKVEKIVPKTLRPTN